MLADLREAERTYAANGQVDDAAVLDALWGLIEAGALLNVAKSVSVLASAGIGPITADEPLLRIGAVVKTHLATAAAAFPLCAGRTQLGANASVVRFLQGDLARLDERRLDRMDEVMRRREDESLTLSDQEAQRAATYILTGILPPPPVQAPARRSSRHRNTSYNPYADWLGENAFAGMEMEMTKTGAKVPYTGW